MKHLVLPPTILLLIAAIGVLALRRRPRLGRGIIAVALIALWLVATPLLATRLIGLLQRPRESIAFAGPAPAEAIVVLASGVAELAPEYGGPTLEPLSLVRLRYGAALQRRFHLPVLLTGGSPRNGVPATAELMAGVMARELGVRPRWLETEASNTWENAARSTPLLRRDGIDTVLLVTHAWHMPRSVLCFEAFGLRVVPAPTGFVTPAPLEWTSLVPTARALQLSAWAAHEVAGMLWYRTVYLGSTQE
jgi:uncharacterized SAM-binding protein YcdF (DUF218 family)